MLADGKPLLIGPASSSSFFLLLLRDDRRASTYLPSMIRYVTVVHTHLPFFLFGRLSRRCDIKNANESNVDNEQTHEIIRYDTLDDVS